MSERYMTGISETLRQIEDFYPTRTRELYHELAGELSVCKSQYMRGHLDKVAKAYGPLRVVRKEEGTA